MQKRPRAQRNTLTYAQMYGGMSHAGMMEGKGIFDKLVKKIKKGIRKVGKLIKGKKVISRGLSLASLLAGKVPGARGKAGALGLSIASQIAKQKGFGRNGNLPSRVKSMSRNQVEAILRGLASQLGSGGVSLAAAKALFPRIKNISAAQMAALRAFRGRHMRGGGVSLSGGRETRLPMSGMGFSGMGIKLAGQGLILSRGRRGLRRKAPQRAQGIKLAGQGDLRLKLKLLKKKVVRRRPRPIAVRRVLI